MTFADGKNGGYLEIEIHLALGANAAADPRTWVFATDITNRGLNRAGVRITGGRADEQTTTESCTIALELFNLNGELTPRNPMSPYFPLLRQSTPIRVRFRPDGVTWYQFVGVIDALPTKWDRSGRDQWIPITATGTLKRFLSNRGPAASRVYNTIMEQGAGIVDYWPMEDGGLASMGASALPNRRPLEESGSVDFATSDGPAGSGKLPGKLLADFGQLSAPGVATASDAWFVGFWLKAVRPTSGQYSGGTILTFAVPGHSNYPSFDVTWSGVTTGGQMILHANTATGAGFSMVYANDVTYDVWHFVMVGAWQSGTGVAYNMWVDGRSTSSFTHTSTTNGTTGIRNLIVSPTSQDKSAALGAPLSALGCGHLVTLSTLADPAVSTFDKGTGVAYRVYQAGVNAGGWPARSEFVKVCNRNGLNADYTWPAVLNANPYFETTASPWTTFGSTVARSTAQFHEGVASLLLTPDGVSSEAQARAEFIPLAEGRIYQFAAWVRCSVARVVRMTVEWHDAGVLVATTDSDQSVSADTWTFLIATFTAPVRATQARPLVRLMTSPPAGHTTWIDEATFTAAGLMYPMGPDQILTDVARLRAIESVVGGVAYDLPDGWIRLDTAADRYDLPVTLTLDYGAGDVAPPIEPTEDTQLTVNDITAMRPDGASARFALDVGPMGTGSIGYRPGTVDVNPFSDWSLIAYAGHAVARGTVDAERYPTVHVDLRARPALIAAALTAARPSRRIKIINPPTKQGYYNAADLLIEGWEIFLDFYSLDVVYNATPYAPYQGFGLVDAATAPAVGGAAGWLIPTSCVTASAMTTTSASVTLTTVPLWNTDAANFPVDVEIEGEVMRATAVAGASNPQTLTVTRSINGVVKAHPTPGAELTIRNPGYLTMEV